MSEIITPTSNLTAKSSRDSIVKRAKELGISQWIHNGANCYMKARLDPQIAKTSLLEEINRIEKGIETSVNTIDEDIPEYAESANEKVEDVKTYIKDSIQQIAFAEKGQDFDKLYNLLGTVPANIITRIVELGTTANTATKYRSQIFSDLDREYNVMKESEFKKRFQYFLKNLRDSVYKSEALQNIVKAKSDEGSARLKERKQNKTAINPTRLIVWAVDTLSKIEQYPVNYWKPVTQAIKVLTGRRTSEILSSGRFVPSSIQGCLLFKGQNKKHSEDSFKNEQPLLIPVIGGHTELILHGMLWLEKSGKRIKPENDTWSAQMDANVKVNKYYGKYLSDFCRGVDGFKVNFYNLVDAESEWCDKKKPDVTRDIYTQVMGVGYYNLIKQELSATLDFLSQILGHSDRGKTIIKYDVDFSVRYTDVARFIIDIDLKNISIK